MINDNLNSNTTPAITKVDECIKAEAPNGASIASNNQIWKPYCADFIAVPNNKKKDNTSITFNLRKKNVYFLFKNNKYIECIWSKSTVPKLDIIRQIKIIKK